MHLLRHVHWQVDHSETISVSDNEREGFRRSFTEGIITCPVDRALIPRDGEQPDE